MAPGTYTVITKDIFNHHLYTKLIKLVLSFTLQAAMPAAMKSLNNILSALSSNIIVLLRSLSIIT
jgi:hypothetical protein